MEIPLSMSHFKIKKVLFYGVGGGEKGMKHDVNNMLWAVGCDGKGGESIYLFSGDINIL